MRVALLETLLCPNCGGRLVASTGVSPPGDVIEYGVLACRCAEYPVVAGIPIFKLDGRVDLMQQTKDSTWRPGPATRDLLSFVKAGQTERALLSLLVIPQGAAAQLISLAGCADGRRRKWLLRLANRLSSAQQRRDAPGLVGARRSASAAALLDYHFRQTLDSELFNHFFYTFGQPRHLAGLALATLFRNRQKPILDLACGVGHYMHYWLSGRPAHEVVGLDRNFFQLYIAKTAVAPEGEFICAEADENLPFQSGTFCGVFCSDAFHYFRRRWSCADEMIRVSEPSGVIVLARFGNRDLAPREGYELTIEGYLGLFEGLRRRIVGEKKLVQEYLQGLGPQLELKKTATECRTEKWLSLVASGDESVLVNHPAFDDWPHAVGRLAINPLYKETGTDGSGKRALRFSFPSRWYALENAGCGRYMPETAEIVPRLSEALEAGSRTEEMESLIRQCILVGMPERYL